MKQYVLIAFQIYTFFSHWVFLSHHYNQWRTKGTLKQNGILNCGVVIKNSNGNDKLHYLFFITALQLK